MTPSKRSQQVKPFLAMELLEKVQVARAAGEDVISLALGEPDFEAPDCVKEAAVRAITDNVTKYTHSQGLFSLREAIAEYYHEKYRVEISPEQILVTSGTSPALFLVFAALLDPGDEVILPNPYYPCYPSFVHLNQGVVKEVLVKEEESFQYRADVVERAMTDKTKAILLTSPANPTGTVMEPETTEEICQLGPTIISDEIYHGLVYEGKEHTALEYTDNVFVLNGFSKSYAMTGFRLGYVIAPQKFVRTLQVLQQNLFISANSFVQQAGLVALREASDDCQRMRAEFNERRQIMIKGLRELGLGIATEPVGAFYVFANAKHLTNDSYAFCLDLFEKTGVAVTPGIDFGSNGEGYLRFSYANSMENIAEALKRIEKYLEN